MTASAVIDAHGIDAVTHILPGGEGQVEGRETEPFAASGARADLSAHTPPIAELPGGLSHLPLAEMLADPARREGRAALAHRRHHVNAEDWKSVVQVTRADSG